MKKAFPSIRLHNAEYLEVCQSSPDLFIFFCKYGASCKDNNAVEVTGNGRPRNVVGVKQLT